MKDGIVGSNDAIETDTAPGRELTGRRILLVEDDVDVALDIEAALTAFGAQVLGPVTSLPQGRSLARRSNGIDAAILDVDLRGEEVFPLAELLEVRRVPLLFYTGRGERPALAERFPAAGICTKPVPADAVIAALSGLLR